MLSCGALGEHRLSHPRRARLSFFLPWRWRDWDIQPPQARQGVSGGIFPFIAMIPGCAPHAPQPRQRADTGEALRPAGPAPPALRRPLSPAAGPGTGSGPRGTPRTQPAGGRTLRDPSRGAPGRAAGPAPARRPRPAAPPLPFSLLHSRGKMAAPLARQLEELLNPRPGLRDPEDDAEEGEGGREEGVIPAAGGGEPGWAGQGRAGAGTAGAAARGAAAGELGPGAGPPQPRWAPRSPRAAGGGWPAPLCPGRPHCQRRSAGRHPQHRPRTGQGRDRGHLRDRGSLGDRGLLMAGVTSAARIPQGSGFAQDRVPPGAGAAPGAGVTSRPRLELPQHWFCPGPLPPRRPRRRPGCAEPGWEQTGWKSLEKGT